MGHEIKIISQKTTQKNYKTNFQTKTIQNGKNEKQCTKKDNKSTQIIHQDRDQGHEIYD